MVAQTRLRIKRRPPPFPGCYHPAMKRPFVLINAAVSLDGKLAPSSRRKVRLGSDRDRARMDRLRAGSDAILIGAGTLRAEDPPLQVKSQALRRGRARRGLPEELLEIVVSGSLELPWRGGSSGTPAPRGSSSFRGPLPRGGSPAPAGGWRSSPWAGARWTSGGFSSASRDGGSGGCSWRGAGRPSPGSSPATSWTRST